MSEESNRAVSPLRQRMIEDMYMRKMQDRTQEAYIRGVRRLARFLGRSPIEERFGVRWADLDVVRVAPRLTARALFIHDRRDRIVPWTQGRAFAEHWPGARLLLTDGLGHARILRDQTIVRAIADFVVGRSEVANLALPPIPRPAPIY